MEVRAEARRDGEEEEEAAAAGAGAGAVGFVLGRSGELESIVNDGFVVAAVSALDSEKGLGEADPVAGVPGEEEVRIKEELEEEDGGMDALARGEDVLLC